ncbi:hypothetical protein RUM44_000266 [Polyplax serrata]|uniref:Uncharacterized protein n=1 Tax=Polyplax serrata TaxID=468196 RepID=A0ABR1B4X8_POLSC
MEDLSSRFLCSEVIAPVKSDVDDISLFIINFEDLSVTPSPVVEENPVVALSKFDRARQSFRKTIKNPLRGRNIKFPGYFSPAGTPIDSECPPDELMGNRVTETELLMNQAIGQHKVGEIVGDGRRETGRFRRLQRTKHSYDLDEMPSMDGLPPTGFHQGTVHGLIRHQSLDDDAVLKNRLEKKDGLYENNHFMTCNLQRDVGDQVVQETATVTTVEDGRRKENCQAQQNHFRPPKSSIKPRSLVQPLPTCLTSVPSLNSVLAPIASPEVQAEASKTRVSFLQNGIFPGDLVPRQVAATRVSLLGSLTLCLVKQKLLI